MINLVLVAPLFINVFFHVEHFKSRMIRRAFLHAQMPSFAIRTSESKFYGFVSHLGSRMLFYTDVRQAEIQPPFIMIHKRGIWVHFDQKKTQSLVRDLLLFVKL